LGHFSGGDGVRSPSRGHEARALYRWRQTKATPRQPAPIVPLLLPRRWSTHCYPGWGDHAADRGAVGRGERPAKGRLCLPVAGQWV